MLLKKLGTALQLKRLRLRRKHARDIQIITASELFDQRFYISMYMDVRADAFWSKNPVLHYLTFGTQENRKPSKDFDTQWYIENNEDVAESGMNPLLHYALHGRQEGRRPNGNRYDHATRDRRELLRHTVVNHLWGGYSKPALADLAAIYGNKDEPSDVRFFAAWHAGRWYFYVGNYKKTLELAELIVNLDPHYRDDKATAMMFAHSWLALGETSKAKEVAENFLLRVPGDTDMLLTLANTVGNDEDKLAITNRVYAPRDLAIVEKRDKTLPLSFDNITAAAAPINGDERVSVIMPIFNAEDKIEAAIRSLLEQSYKNLEIIVVDDRSTDNTFTVVKKIAEAQPRVKAFQQEKNGGAYLARNRGLKEASGDYITTHDADDWSHPDKIATQVELLQRKETVMGVCLHWTRALDNLTFTHNWNLNARLVHWNHSSFLFRKRVIDDLGPWDSVIVGGDTEFIWRVQAHYGNGSVVKYKPNIPFSFALDDEGSLTRTKATHVKTIHNGLRHIYRSAAQWWHTHASDLSVSVNQRRFPAPKAMLKRGDVNLRCDKLIIAEFGVSQDSENAILAARQALDEGLRVGLLHWPAYGSEKEELAADFFQLLLNDNCDVVVFGMQVECEEAVVQSRDLMAPMLEMRPVIIAKLVRMLEGEPLIESEQENLRITLKTL
ncbi:glycosyltransferase family 2 protein [Alteromonas pelagimontana]|uniref:Glycosyltransferase family 2 protein n=1 Tax=Alteromonas pelagimontana TaxID=1858656 RepID=A0A6M4MEM5_9ALTE|nr:glycosyltransferase family A protein [Alteromonas pelagimontana]QJR81533.1 glycosyltransferase family 2 protein [Alteromonas pelagimontana]